MTAKFYLAVISFFITHTTMAQFSPALGPPQAGLASIPLRKISFAVISSLVKMSLDSAVAGINKKINSSASSSGINATLSCGIESALPVYKQTEFVNAPNEMRVYLEIKVVYTVSKIRYHGNPYYSRKLFQKIVAAAQCDKWQTGEGKSKITCTAQKPFADELLFDEPVLNFFFDSTLTAYAEAGILQSLGNGAAWGELPIPGESCNCLNFKMGTAPAYSDGYAGFYYFPVRKIAVEALYSDPEMRLLSVKRFAPAGEILLDTEDLQIEYRANFNKDVITVKPIEENETVAFKDDYSIKFEHPNQYNRLVVTANVTILNKGRQMLSGFLHFEKDNKFGEGVQKLTIMREVWRPASTRTDGEPVMPFKTLMPAYELVFSIKYDKRKTIK
jgi:hypothetical protein